MKTEKEVFESIKKLNLFRVPDFDKLTLKQFKEIYNGFGPDSWPLEAREAMTWVYTGCQELAGVHDVGYHFSDGTLRGWKDTQRRWLGNMAVLLNANYPLYKFWLWKMRLIMWAKCRIAYRVLSLHSLKVYKKAHSKR